LIGIWAEDFRRNRQQTTDNSNGNSTATANTGVLHCVQDDGVTATAAEAYRVVAQINNRKLSQWQF
jgi:hypothetical protein